MSAALLAVVLGLVGQGIRAAVGLVKLYQADGDFSAFRGRVLVVSLVPGGIAGWLGSLVLAALGFPLAEPLARLAVVTFGYAGADAIDGVFAKMMKWLEGRSLS